MPKGKKLQIESNFGPYNLEIFENQISLRETLEKFKESYFMIDSNVYKIYEEEIFKPLNLRNIFLVDASEDSKSIQMVEKIAEWLLGLGADKSARLVAIGGGVLQDLATFVSAIYYRGIKWTFVPTTLLAMCDSSIGGKCALNLGGFKNQLGLIYPPKDIRIFSHLLVSLSKREIVSGYGEMLKLSLTGNPLFYEGLKNQLRLRGTSAIGIEDLIYKSLMAKKHVIEIDELETDYRRVLNYGHSFGHALEAATKNSISHGQAIVFGMDIINFISMKKGFANLAFVNDFRSLAEEFFDLSSLVRIAQGFEKELFEFLHKDKKSEKGFINFALISKPGELFVERVDLDEELRRNISEYFVYAETHK